MLRDWEPPALSEMDQTVFDKLVRQDHYLRRALNCIDFARLRARVADRYSPDRGRPADDPLLLLKLEFLQYHDNLSDRQVISRARTDIAYRYFLTLGMDDPLPDPSLLSYFRGRLGVEGHRAIFEDVVSQAREHGLVKDRLRIKDATEVLANVAIPTTLSLTAQLRNRLLNAAVPFDSLRVEGERARVETIRLTTQGGSDDVRLLARITHLREILAWVNELSPPEGAAENLAWQKLVEIRRIAHKILADQADPQAGDRTRSVTDPDARRGKHGGYYDGYLVDLLVDPDSELITAVNVLPGNGDEAADAPALIRQEEAAHGNDIPELSIDGIGFNGPMLRELQDPQGLDTEVVVPPKAQPDNGRFSPDEFREDTDRGVVICPAGEESRYRQRDTKQHATIHRFDRATCRGCPLLDRCMEKPPAQFGRTVRKNDYEPELRRAREKATTPHYAAVRAVHPKVERKLSDVVRNHGGRRARYRGLPKVLCQELAACMAANVKRIVRLLGAGTLAPSSA